jgi:diguanylate cyclase (GGDEF)-like protein/PAS domain S-box-containing protein
MEPSEELRQLREEVEVLRASAAAQEAHLGAVTEEMDAMLIGLEQQRNELTAALAHAASVAGLLDRINETVDDLVVFAGADGRILRVNRRQAERIGLVPAQLLGASLDSLLADQDLQQLAHQRQSGAMNARGVLCETVCAHGRFAGELRLKVGGAASATIWQLRAAVVLTAQGKIDGVVAIFTDVTDWREAETQMRLAANVFQSTAEAIMVTDTQGTILSVNPAFTQISGFTAQEALGATPRIFKSDHHHEKFYAEMWRVLIQTGSWQGDVWNRRKNGELFLKRGVISMIPDALGQPSRYVSVFSDYTEIWHKDEHTRHLAFHDALTDLANRALLEDRLEHATALARREARELVLMFLDLDGFKQVNDSFGHEIGDRVLRTVSDRLKSLVRVTDTVARLGGDEFVVLLEQPPAQQAEIVEIVQRMIDSIGQPMLLGVHTVRIGVSIGIATFPHSGSEPSELLHSADAAMYSAKSAGKNTFRFGQTG